MNFRRSHGVLDLTDSSISGVSILTSARYRIFFESKLISSIKASLLRLMLAVIGDGMMNVQFDDSITPHFYNLNDGKWGISIAVLQVDRFENGNWRKMTSWEQHSVLLSGKRENIVDWALEFEVVQED